MKKVAIIPARMASSRFPGKPLADIQGLSMIGHVYRRVRLCDSIDDVLIATCDREIMDNVQAFGGKAVMTSSAHQSCVDRVAEAAAAVDADIVINVQGDMPFLRPESLHDLVKPFETDGNLLFTDMMGPISEPEELSSVNVVKVVVDRQGNALYYSREAIPSSRKESGDSAFQRHKQFGINAFRREGLEIFVAWKRGLLEDTESVDMLRPLEHGYKVRMVVSPHPVIGVDTRADLQAAIEMMTADPVFALYKKSEIKIK